jgi:tRNA threonylcarbamoyladenosine biosynthesis protein TsaB
MPDSRALAVAFDTSSELAGVALFEDGLLLAETTWRTRRNPSRELLPSLDWLLGRAGRAKEHIGALFICSGPGSYAGLRVGMSTAKALAFALDACIVGVGRLEADAEPLVPLTRHRVVAVHAAGRAELAWAAYQRGQGDEIAELQAPRLGHLEALLRDLKPEDLVCAELRTLDAGTQEALAGAGTLVEVPSTRVAAVARIGQLRWVAGAVGNPDTLVPLYLRAPAIGPQN